MLIFDVDSIAYHLYPLSIDSDLSPESGSTFPLLSFTSKELPVSLLLEDLHDAGVFSLCGLVALLCHKYFPEAKHRYELIIFLDVDDNVVLNLMQTFPGENGTGYGEILQVTREAGPNDGDDARWRGW